MYTFKSETERQQFETTIDTCLEAFKKAKQHKQKETIQYEIYWLRIAQANQKTDSSDALLIYSYLNRLYDEQLWEFTEEELKIFKTLTI